MAAAALLTARAPLVAQAGVLRDEVTAGSDAEGYLRLLQVVGQAPLYPWTLRALSPGEVARLAPSAGTDPWAPRFAADSTAGRRARFTVLRPGLRTVYNTTFASGGNDGAVWAGRGVTAAASAGFVATAGPLSLRVEPLAFWAQNREFGLMPNGRPDSLRFGDGQAPRAIDLPQRFGDGAYARVDPGQSELRLDVVGVAVGVSTANQVWGPAIDQPMILGTNAAGFPHAFAGTSRPVNVGIGRVHARLVWGSLAQSSYSSMAADSGRRLMTGVVGSFQPRGLAGLEVGGMRFFQARWPDGGPSLHDLLEPLQPVLKRGLDDTGEGPDSRSSPDNQLASAFFRWVLPRAGAEFYGEYAREDHNWDLQDLLLHPDHTAAYLLGGRKAWRNEGGITSARLEWTASQPGSLQQVRSQGHFYRHSRERQGHTERGQLLGSASVYGGGGAVAAVERYTPAGRWSLDLSRMRVRPQVAADSTAADVLTSLGASALLFHRGFDASLRLQGDWELNRYFADDRFNLSAVLGLRVGL